MLDNTPALLAHRASVLWLYAMPAGASHLALPLMASIANGSSRLAALERALLQLERKLPILRKHVAEHAHLPTPLHHQQLVATLELMARALMDLHPGVRQPTV